MSGLCFHSTIRQLVKWTSTTSVLLLSGDLVPARACDVDGREIDPPGKEVQENSQG